MKEIDASKLSIVGASAGGNAALVSLLKAKEDKLIMPSSLSLLSPWCDLLNRGDSHFFNEGRDPKLNMNWINEALKGYVLKNDLNSPYLSPINGIYDKKFPSTFISSGTRDLFLSQCVRLHNLFKLNYIDSTIKIWDDLWHTFEMNYEIPEAKQSLKEISNFIITNFKS